MVKFKVVSIRGRVVEEALPDIASSNTLRALEAIVVGIAHGARVVGVIGGAASESEPDRLIAKVAEAHRSVSSDCTSYYCCSELPHI